MNDKTLRILIGSAVALIFVLFLMESGTKKGTTDSADLLLPDMQAVVNDADFIQISAAGSAPIEIVKIDGQWKVPNRQDYIADFAIVRDILASMAQAKILEKKTANPALHNRLGLEETTIENSKGTDILARVGNAEFNLIFGTVSQGQFRYARIGGDNQSWLVDQNPDIPSESANWLKKEIIDIDSTRIKAVTITHPDGEIISVYKTSAEEPNFEVLNIPPGRELTYSTVGNGIGGALNDLDLEDVRKAIEGSELVITEFTTFDGLNILVKIIIEDEANWISLEVTSEETENSEASEIMSQISGWQYQVPSYKANLLTRKLEDILKPDQEEE